MIRSPGFSFPEKIASRMALRDGIYALSRHIQSLHLLENPPKTADFLLLLRFYYMEPARKSQFFQRNSHSAQNPSEDLSNPIDYKYLIIDNSGVKL